MISKNLYCFVEDLNFLYQKNFDSDPRFIWMNRNPVRLGSRSQIHIQIHIQLQIQI